MSWGGAPKLSKFCLGKESCMRRLKLIFVIVIFLEALSVSFVFAEEGKEYLLKDSSGYKAAEMPVCKDLYKILSRPENIGSVGYTCFANPIVFPENKNFEEIAWAPVSMNEVERSFPKEMLNNELERERKYAYLNKCGSDENFVFEKAGIKLDDTNNIYTVFRYRLPKWKVWILALGDDAPPRYKESFNFRLGTSRTAFVYGGRVYMAENFIGSVMSIVRYKSLFIGNKFRKGTAEWNAFAKTDEWKNGVDLYGEELCSIKNPNASKEYKEYLRQEQRE